MNKKCDTLRFNYYVGSTVGEYPERYEERIVGIDQVVDIIESKDGKHYFDVIYSNDRVERIFNPHQAFYSIAKEPSIPDQMKEIWNK